MVIGAFPGEAKFIGSVMVKILAAFGAASAILLLAVFSASAAPPETALLDQFSLGAGVIDYGKPRIYHATTECHKSSCVPLSHHVADKVEADRKARVSGQMLLEYHGLGRKSSSDPFLSADGLFGTVVSSYGFNAADKKVVDGLGVGYTLAVTDAFQHKDSLNFGLGAVHLDEVQVLRRGAVVGKPIAVGLHSPTRTTGGWDPMFTLSLAL